MKQPILDLRNLSKRFDGLAALSAFDAHVEEGEILGLIGPNGAGKTTLFNVLTGFVHPDSGEVRLRGRNIIGRSPHWIARRGMVRTFQNLRLVEKLTVLENVLLWFQDQLGEHLLALFTRPGRCRAHEEANQTRGLRLLERVGLVDQATCLAYTLSYGQRKLLSIACCLAAEPTILLLDEPIAGVAPERLQSILGLVQSLREEGKTILMIEHNLEAIASTCDRVVFMDAGRKLSEGPFDVVRRDPKVIEAYLR